MTKNYWKDTPNSLLLRIQKERLEENRNPNRPRRMVKNHDFFRGKLKDLDKELKRRKNLGLLSKSAGISRKRKYQSVSYLGNLQRALG